MAHRFACALTYFAQYAVEEVREDAGRFTLVFPCGKVYVDEGTTTNLHELRGMALQCVNYSSPNGHVVITFVRPPDFKRSQAEVASLTVRYDGYEVEHPVTGRIRPGALVTEDNLPPDPSVERVAQGPVPHHVESTGAELAP